MRRTKEMEDSSRSKPGDWRGIENLTRSLTCLELWVGTLKGYPTHVQIGPWLTGSSAKKDLGGGAGR